MKFENLHFLYCTPECPGDPGCPKTFRSQEAAYERALPNMIIMRAVLADYVDLPKAKLTADDLDALLYRLYRIARETPAPR